jgi:gamma-glutamyl hydrolase
MKAILVNAILLSQIICTLAAPGLPVIAIYANPNPDFYETYNEDKVQEWYVRWIEQSGGVTMVIHIWYSKEQIDDILSKANGVLFQGGDRDLILGNRWENNALYILEKIKEINDGGKHLPLWAACQGQELLFSLIANTTSVLEKFDAWNIPLPLELLTNTRSSKMFSLFSEEDFNNVSTQPITAHFHNLGTSVEKFLEYENLSSFFKITTLGSDRQGKEFIATFEAIKYPIYGPQFHPEKVPYDRRVKDVIPRTIAAVRVSQNFGDFFIEEARKNDNKFLPEDALKYDFIDSFVVGNQTIYYNYYVYDKPENGLKTDLNFLEK